MYTSFRSARKPKIGWIVLRGSSVGLGVALLPATFLTCVFIMVSGGFNIIDYVTWKHNDYGNVLIIDPDTMDIVTQARAPERCSFARMAVYPGVAGDHDWLITLGDYSVMKWKYLHSNHALELQPEWSERYRSFNDGSFYGTGPAVYNNTVYYTDNTFPVMLGKGYRLYAKSLLTNEPQQMAQLAPNSPGFMFWSVTISPLAGNVIVWDINNNNIQSRSLHDLSLRWQVNVKNMDCLSVAADRGHVYATESVVAMDSVSAHLFASVPIGEKFYQADKYFLVLDAATGNIIQRIPMAFQDAVSAGLVAPGANNDVIVSTGKRLLRIYYSNSTDSSQGIEIPQPESKAHPEL